MKKFGLPFLLLVLLLVAAAGNAAGETISWSNPAKYADNTAIASDNQAKIKNYLRYRVGTGSWTYFAETTGGKTSWTGTLPVAEGVTAGYSVSAALTGADGMERDSAYSPEVKYMRPFAVRIPGAPSGVAISP
jgi:hypothetical protein